MIPLFAAIMMAAIPAKTPAVEAPQGQVTLCLPREWARTPGGEILYNDTFGPPGQIQCVTEQGRGFTVTRSVTPRIAWQGYPDLFIGCEYTVCSANKEFPARVSTLGNLRMTLWTRYPSVGQMGNDATDTWFTKTNPGNSPTHPNGAELMLWLSESGEPPAPGVNVRIPGAGYWHFATWRPYQNGVTWTYIQLYRLGRHHEPSVTHLAFGRIITWCERQGLIRKSWWLSSSDAGFEIVHNGKSINVIRNSITGATVTPTPTITPSPAAR
jgi:Glycosyl hydrolase family 12